MSRRSMPASRARARILAAVVAMLAAAVPFAATAAPAHAVMPTNGLVGYWPFDEGTGTTSADMSGSGNTATLGSAAGWTSNAAPIAATNPFALASTRTAGSSASATGTNIDGLTQYTVAFWFRENPVTTTTHFSIVEIPGKLSFFDDAFASTLNGQLLVSHNLHFDFNVGGPQNFDIPNGFAYDDGQWHSVAGTYDGTTARMYLDGVERLESPETGVVPAGNGVVFSSPSTPLDGALDDVRIYNRALTVDELSQLGSFDCTNTQGVSIGECQGLANLYNSTDGPHWTHHDGWLENNQPCTWYGVVCDTSTNHVNSLVLSNNGLSGPLDTLLGGLDHLTVLNLSGNALTGGIPPGLGTVTSLETLDVSGNQLSNRIPATFGDPASALHFLEVENNALHGPIPTGLANLSQLVGIDLSDNALGTTDPTLTALLNRLEPDWASTQTVAPGNVRAVRTSPTTITVTWNPIAYTADGGYYDVLDSPGSSGTFQSAGHTADKTATGFTLTGLDPNETYQLSVRTFTPAHPASGQQNDVLSDATPPIGAVTGYFTSSYAPSEYRNLYVDAVVFQRNDLASTQHDAAMFLAYLAGVVRSQGGSSVDLGTDPGTGPLAVTSSYTADELDSLQQAAQTFSTDPATLQRVGVDLVAFLVAISSH